MGEGWCAGEFESFGELAGESRNPGFDLDGLDGAEAGGVEVGRLIDFAIFGSTGDRIPLAESS